MNLSRLLLVIQSFHFHSANLESCQQVLASTSSRRAHNSLSYFISYVHCAKKKRRRSRRRNASLKRVDLKILERSHALHSDIIFEKLINLLAVFGLLVNKVFHFFPSHALVTLVVAHPQDMLGVLKIIIKLDEKRSYYVIASRCNFKANHTAFLLLVFRH